MIAAAPFLRVEAVSVMRDELLVRLADGDHGIYAVDGYYRLGELVPVPEWRELAFPAGYDYDDEPKFKRDLKAFEAKAYGAATHCRFTARETEYEIPLGSNVGEIIPIGAGA